MKRGTWLERLFPLLLIALMLTPSLLHAADMDRTLTLYTRNIASVSETQTVTFDKGTGVVNLTGIIPAVVDGSVMVDVVKDGEITLHSVQINDNLFDLDKYWASRIGESVTISHDDTSSTGLLKRATSSHLFLEIEGKLLPFARSQADKGLEIASIPAGLVTEPTLTLHYTAKKGGDRTLRLSYLVEGVSWNGVHRVDLEKGTRWLPPGLLSTTPPVSYWTTPRSTSLRVISTWRATSAG